MAKKSYILKEIRSSNSIYNKYHNLQNIDKNILFFLYKRFYIYYYANQNKLTKQY